MIKKKICMLGSYAVGKTSLVRRFVSNEFSDQYITTIGVKVENVILEVEKKEIQLVLWDIHGDDDFQKIKSSYLRGTSAYFLVADGTRAETFNKITELHQFAQQATNGAPAICLLNKADLKKDWCQQARSREGILLPVIETSAKEDSNVQSAFQELSKLIMF